MQIIRNTVDPLIQDFDILYARLMKINKYNNTVLTGLGTTNMGAISMSIQDWKRELFYLQDLVRLVDRINLIECTIEQRNECRGLVLEEFVSNLSPKVKLPRRDFTEKDPRQITDDHLVLGMQLTKDCLGGPVYFYIRNIENGVVYFSNGECEYAKWLVSKNNISIFVDLEVTNKNKGIA